MTRQTPHSVSSQLPYQIVALGPQQPDEEKAFLVANASYRAIRFLGEALSLRWLETLLVRHRALAKKNRTAPYS